MTLNDLCLSQCAFCEDPLYLPMTCCAVSPGATSRGRQEAIHSWLAHSSTSLLSGENLWSGPSQPGQELICQVSLGFCESLFYSLLEGAAGE